MEKERKRWKKSIDIDLSVDRATAAWNEGCEGPISVCLSKIKS